jgi:hypothetical protein
MTAEAAVLNKIAIALAVDSAVTVKQENGEGKIYNTVDKLFCLSCSHPVGIMIFGNAEFIGTPWETIIGAFRRDLGETKYNTLEDYGNHLIKLIETNKQLVSNAQENQYLFETVINRLFQIKKEINLKVEKEIENKKQLKPSEIILLIDTVLSEHLSKLNKFEILEFATDSYQKKVILKIKKLSPRLIKQVFEKLPLNTSQLDIINKIISETLFRERYSTSSSGLVIAGYGERDYFPYVIEYRFQGMLFRKVKYQIKDISKVDAFTTAYIIPFAQKEMVYQFIEGIDPGIDERYSDFIEMILTKFPSAIINKVPLATGTDKDKLIKKLTKFGKSVLSTFEKDMKKYKKEHQSNPIIGAVAVMPKTELATMAESLVQLTSLKKKFSLQSETVGGFINVALISKSEGFIWVKKETLGKVV